MVGVIFIPAVATTSETGFVAATISGFFFFRKGFFLSIPFDGVLQYTKFGHNTHATVNRLMAVVAVWEKCW